MLHAPSTNRSSDLPPAGQQPTPRTGVLIGDLHDHHPAHAGVVLFARHDPKPATSLG
jgi:hypothetical protein